MRFPVQFLVLEGCACGGMKLKIRKNKKRDNKKKESGSNGPSEH